MHLCIRMTFWASQSIETHVPVYRNDVLRVQNIENQNKRKPTKTAAAAVEKQPAAEHGELEPQSDEGDLEDEEEEEEIEADDDDADEHDDNEDDDAVVDTADEAGEVECGGWASIHSLKNATQHNGTACQVGVFREDMGRFECRTVPDFFVINLKPENLKATTLKRICKCFMEIKSIAGDVVTIRVSRMVARAKSSAPK